MTCKIDFYRCNGGTFTFLSIRALMPPFLSVRMVVQQERDAVQKTLEEFKTENNRFMASVNKKVTQGKEKHENLTHEVGLVFLCYI